MRIFVFSDSHGRWEPMLSLLTQDPPDLVIHLGDHTADADALRARTMVPLLSVAGNSSSDRASGVPDHRLITLEGHQLYLCHGHLHNVKSSLIYLSYSMQEQGVDLALFGHTHFPCDEQFGSVRLINPGSARSMYAVLTLTADSVSVEHRPIPQQ